MSQMSQKVTLSNADKRHLPRIKAFLLEGKNQLDISRALNLRRETVNRKVRRWMQTEDFDLWLKEVWVDLYRQVRREDVKEAFRQVTKLLTKSLGVRADAVIAHAEATLKVIVSPKLISEEDGASTT